MNLSIIIPIYNVEEYISRCLDSIYTQGVEDSEFEIFAIIDGSPDNSSMVVKKYADLHKNLHLVEQNNAGVSSARNNGIRRSLGKYLMFVDPDDVLIEGGLSKVLHLVEQKPSEDLIIFKSFEENNEIYKWSDLFDIEKVYNANQILQGGYLRGSVWGCVYKRDFIMSNNIWFIEGMRNGEDTNFNLQILFYSNKISFANINLYRLIGRDGSATRIFNKDRIDAMIKSVKTVSAMANELSKKEGNSASIPYMTYSSISNLVFDTIRTPNLGYHYLVRHGITRALMIGELNGIKFLRKKMIVLKSSFVLFYILSWIKNK
ncbi:MAG: glycosyltransferase [Paludibacteraceae bacterium]|nr:glycosyltransferase [Paludibacteraceae bacterium]